MQEQEESRRSRGREREVGTKQEEQEERGGNNAGAVGREMCVNRVCFKGKMEMKGVAGAFCGWLWVDGWMDVGGWIE